MRIRFLRRIAIFCIAVPIGLFVVCTKSAFARSDTATLNAKAILTGVRNCIAAGAYSSDWAVSDGFDGFAISEIDGEAVKLPYKLTDADDNNNNCKEVMGGWSVDYTIKNDRLKNGLFGAQDGNKKGEDFFKNSDNAVIAETFAGPNHNGVGGLGYTAKGIGEEVKLIKKISITMIPYDVNRTDTCPASERELKVSDGSGNYVAVPDQTIQFIVGENSNYNHLFLSSQPDSNAPSSGKTKYYSICGEPVAIRLIRNKDGLLNGMTITINHSGLYVQPTTYTVHAYDKVTVREEDHKGANIHTTIKIEDDLSGATSFDATDYQLTLNTDGWKDLLVNLAKYNKIGYSLDIKDETDLKLSEQEVYDLYTYYLTSKDVFNVPVICSDEEGYSIYENMGKPVKYKKDAECRALVDDSGVKKNLTNVYGVDGDRYFQAKIDSIQDILDTLELLTIENLDTESAGTLVVTDGRRDLEEESTCESSGAAKSLGWIVCPILEWMSDAAQDIYNDYVAPSLRIEPQLFTGGDHATRDAWEMFRNVANVIFIIFFLIIIFSQLTGVGIDNYGIKKTLPKVVLVAVLVNLSFLMCQICVDLSNILGNSIQALFDSMSSGFEADAVITIGGVEEPVEAGGGAAISAVLILVGVVGVGAVIFNPAILLTLLIAALGVVVSILFLFALLAARQAVVVIMTLLCPLAIVCYILPNMKKMYEKWLKLWEGMLLLYPICGLMVGGGNYVSKLLLATGLGDQGLFGAFTAMIVGVVPIFFIPTVLKGSFNAMGKLGGMMTGLGDTAKKGVTSGLKNSEINKGLQAAGKERQTRMRAGLDRNGNKVQGPMGKLMRGIGNVASGGKRQRQRNALAYQRMLSERGSLDAADGEEFMLRTQTANEMKALEASGDINDQAALEKGLEDALASDDKAKIRAYSDALFAKGKDGRKRAARAYNNAVDNKTVSNEAALAFSNNILENHGSECKDNYRSLYEVAKQINQSRGGTKRKTTDYLNTKEGNNTMSNREIMAGKLTSSSMGGMDDDAFEEVFHFDKNGNFTNASDFNSDLLEQLGAVAYAAVFDENSDLKAERREKLKKIIAKSGYKPEARRVTFS